MNKIINKSFKRFKLDGFKGDTMLKGTNKFIFTNKITCKSVIWPYGIGHLQYILQSIELILNLKYFPKPELYWDYSFRKQLETIDFSNKQELQKDNFLYCVGRVNNRLLIIQLLSTFEGYKYLERTVNTNLEYLLTNKK